MTVTIDNLQCSYAKSPGGRILYMLYPFPLSEKAMDNIASTYGISVVVITGMDWDNDMTPWEAPGVPAGCADFKGNALAFLTTLQNSVIPAVEKDMAIDITERNLIGVSLSGLFTLWQWMICDTFRNIASLSGSFWYKDFVDWLKKNCVQKTGRAYFLLGNLESRTSVPEFKSVDTDTREVMDILHSHLIDATFESVPGNHYQYAAERLRKALDYFYL